MFPLQATLYPHNPTMAYIALALAAAALLVLAAIYAWQAWKSRGKPKVERRGTLNLGGDMLFDGWASGPGMLGSPTSSPAPPPSTAARTPTLPPTPSPTRAGAEFFH